MSRNYGKDMMIKGLQEIIHPYNTTENGHNTVDAKQQTSIAIDADILLSKNFSKSVKTFIEHSVLNDIDRHLKEIKSINKDTWNSEVNDLTKTLLDESKILCIQDNLTNAVDSCLKEVKDPNLKYLSDSDLDISPLLQPEHVAEVAECISTGKPLDVRLNALRILLKSHITEAVNGEGWFLLQKKLVENLCDNNLDVFETCMSIHIKLSSSASSEAIKECVLNLLESLGRHYYLQHDNCKIISFQDMHFYRMVHLSSLLLGTLREATSNVARFGESRLNEIVDNFIQLLSLHVPNKHSRNTYILSPLEVISYLDPFGKWLVNLTHFVITRQLFFASLCKNVSFLRIIVEEVVDWLSEPVIPSRNTCKILQGEINFAVHRYSLFCHSLASLTIICSFSTGCTLFPINTNKREGSLTIDDILILFITSLNDTRFNDILQTKSTEMFKTFISKCIAQLLCLKGINGSFYLLKFLNLNETQELITNPVKVNILDFVSQYEHFNNPFVNIDSAQKRKTPMILLYSSGIPRTSFTTDHNSGNVKQKRGTERQGSIISLTIDGEMCESVPFEIYLKQITEKLKYVTLPNVALFKIMTKIFKDYYGNFGINNVLRVKNIKAVTDIYKKQEKLRHLEPKSIDNINVNLSEHCAQFLFQICVSPLGFHTLQELGVVTTLLQDGLHEPLIDWSDPTWLLFLSKAMETNEGCEVIALEVNGVFKKELIELWTLIEEDCSGSEVPIEDMSKLLFRIAATFSLSVKGVKAILTEPKDGSDITLTDEHDIRPSNFYSLINQFALNAVNCPDFIHHQFALTVLDILLANINSSLYMQHTFNYQDILLQIQADNRLDENSEVIIDECSLLRQKIIEQTYLPGRMRGEVKPTHTAPRPESTLTRAKPRSRGTGELARWLSETRLGLHDHNWLKHARKMYRNFCYDDIKGSTLIDLLEQVVKVLPETRLAIKWQLNINEDTFLTPEEEIAVQLVIRYGTHHRLIQSTQQNLDNLTQFIKLTKISLGKQSHSFEGFDWFAASAYLICSGNIEKSQNFLTLISTLPNAPLIWLQLGEPSILAQLGNLLETVIAEEMPTLYQFLRSVGLSWWQLCHSWLSQCWWNMMDWLQICHWLTLSILHQSDHSLYFFVALLHVNHDRLLKCGQQTTLYEIILNPVEKFQVVDARVYIEKLHKKYHNLLHSQLASILHS